MPIPAIFRGTSTGKTPASPIVRVADSPGTLVQAPAPPLPPTMSLQQLLQYLSRSRKHAAGKAPLVPERGPATCAALGDPARSARPAGLADRRDPPPGMVRAVQRPPQCGRTTGPASCRPLPSASDSELGRWLHHMRQGPAQGDSRFDTLVDENNRFHQLAQQALTWPARTAWTSPAPCSTPTLSAAGRGCWSCCGSSRNPEPERLQRHAPLRRRGTS